MTLAGDWRHLLAGCDAQQHAAIVSEAAPLLVVAGAGSGKTRVLTRRIAWRIVEETAVPARVLALTYTRKAAAELRGRLGALGLPAPVTAGTFHAVAFAELRRYELEQGRRPPVVLDRKAALLAEILPEERPRQSSDRNRGPDAREPASRPVPGRPARIQAERGPAERARFERGPAERTRFERGRSLARREVLRAVAAEIEWAAAQLVTPDRYPQAASEAKRPVAVDLELVASCYDRYQKEKRRRGLLDFDDLLARLAHALASDPDLAATQRWRFRHFFVDELQDATPAQLRLLGAWLGGRTDLFAVGDPRQAIYGWNGADPGVVEQFATRYPGATVLRLDTNYRSTPQVVSVAASTLEARGTTPVPVQRPDGILPTIRSYAGDQEEAEGVARILRLAQRPGRRWSDCAVLARTNAQLLVFEPVLRAAGIPVRSSSASAFLASPNLAGVLEALRAGRSSFAAWLVDLEEEGPEHSDAGGDRSERAFELAELGRLGREYAATDSSPTGEGFLAWAASALRSDPSPSHADAVDLITFHRAKGLEWRVVCVTGLEDGLVPIFQAKAPEAREEERRLLYVALTRALDELHCSWAAVRHFGALASNRQPSPYLEPIEAAIRDLARAASPDPARSRAVLAEARAALDASRSEPQPPLSAAHRRRPSPPAV